MSKIILKKNSTDYPLLTMPNHYPADRVYLDGDTTKNVQDAVDKSQAMIATVQPNLTAVKAYAKGEQFVYNGLLYKTTAAISSGGTITINGNCELADSVTEQIDSKQVKILSKELLNVTSDATYGIIDLGIEGGYFVVSVAAIEPNGYLYLPLYVYPQNKWYAVCVSVSPFAPAMNHNVSKLYVSYYPSI